MAVRKTESAKNSGSASRGSGSAENKAGRSPLKSFFVFLIVIFTLAVLGTAVYCVVRLPGMLLVENRRFAFKNLEVSPSYWQTHKEELARRLNLERGKSIFAIDAGKVRRQLMNIPNIELAEVHIVLPDTLVLKITERIPRAVLFNQRSDLAVDEYGVKIKRSESMLGNQALPVITGMRAGENMDRQLAPALRLIMTALRGFQDISISWISVRHENYLDVRLFYRRGPQEFRVLFPLTDHSFMLSVVQSAILEAGRRGEARTYFDLRTRGRVITK